MDYLDLIKKLLPLAAGLGVPGAAYASPAIEFLTVISRNSGKSVPELIAQAGAIIAANDIMLMEDEVRIRKELQDAEAAAPAQNIAEMKANILRLHQKLEATDDPAEQSKIRARLAKREAELEAAIKSGD